LENKAAKRVKDIHDDFILFWLFEAAKINIFLIPAKFQAIKMQIGGNYSFSGR
jgi:hypothetical protein